MIYRFLTLFLFSLPLFASIENLKSYETSFVQTIIDQDGSKIVYTGTFSAKKPEMALWTYTTPVYKKVYINGLHVTIIEPELEQAIYKKNSESFTLFNLFKDAKRIDAKTYEKVIDKRTYTLKVDQDRILSLHYDDNFENHVTIVFDHQEPNKALENQHFSPQIPDGFDIIQE